jgi:replication factor C small subunit
MDLKSTLWTEKYRPKAITDYVFSDPQQKLQIENWIEKQDIQNVIFYGPAGTGKTTLVKVLVNELNIDPYDFLMINASRERSIDVIRNQVSSFAATMPFGRMKILALDEFDGATPEAQAALKAVIEMYPLCRWLFTANSKNRIIPPIHSRCQSMEIAKLDITEYTTRAAQILVDENIDFDLETLDIYVKAYWPDLRKCINSLQLNSIDGKLISPSSVNSSSADYKLIALTLFKDKKYREARKIVCEQIRPEETDDFFRFLYDNLHLFGNTPEQLDQAIIVIKNNLVKIPLAADHEILISATITELMQIATS